MLQTEVASRDEVIKVEEETVKVAPRRTKVQTRCIKKTEIQSKFFIFLQFCIVKFGKIDALYCPGPILSSSISSEYWASEINYREIPTLVV